MRTILACLFAFWCTLVAAQAPSPVPALPDVPRLTQYSIVSSNCNCPVNFALYGDGTDVDNWIQVFIGTQAYLSTDPLFGWVITSASGSLANIPRPITNAVLNFNTLQSGTVTIVGARRPRRLTQFQENRGVPARDLNQAITDEISQNREAWDRAKRSLMGQPGEVISLMPPAASRATNFLAFDANGNPIAVTLPTTSGFVTTSRNVFSYSPVYDLAGNTLSANNLLGVTGAVVPAGDTYDDIRISQSSGTNTLFTVGAASIAAPIYSSPEATSGSNSSGNVYGAVLHATNDGPATVRGAHLGGFATTGSTGFISAAGLQIQPVSTTLGAWGAFASLTSSGANGIAVAYGIESNGDSYQLGAGSVINPVNYTLAAYRAWMGSGSSTNARAFQIYNNAGSEIAYWHKDGSIVGSGSLTLGNNGGTGGGISLNGSTSGSSSLTLSSSGQLLLTSSNALTAFLAVGSTSGSIGLNGSTSGNVVLSTPATGGMLQFASSGSFSANGSVATVLGSIGPTGSHTTVQTWLTIVDSGGVTRYIPGF